MKGRKKEGNFHFTSAIEDIVLEEFQIATCRRGSNRWSIGEHKEVAEYHGELNYADMLQSLEDNPHIFTRTAKDNKK